MANERVEQKLSVSVSQPDTPWKSDVVLATPVHIAPADGDTLCPDQPAGYTSRIYLEWEAVSGATFYVLQWCNNTSFQGPTLRSVKQAETSYQLPLGFTGIRMDEEIHWRVMAFNNSGGVSQKSKSWKVAYKCETKQASGKGDNKSGGPQGPGGKSKCSDFDIHMKIEGADKVKCCETHAYKLQLIWVCKDANGRDLISFGGTTWSIVNNPADNLNVINNQDDKSCDVTFGCVTTQMATIKAVASFTDLVEGGVFTCEATFEVFVDCENVTPEDVDIITHVGYGIPTIVHPDYVADTIAPVESMRGADSPVGVTTMDPVTASTESAPPAGTVPIEHVMAMGPVVVTAEEVIPEPTLPGDPCAQEITLGNPTAQVLEAQTHLAFGCGLKKHGTHIDVNNEHLAGESGSRRGIAANGHCSLQVHYGCGLTIENERLVVKTTPLETAGTIYSVVPGSLTAAFSGCELTVEFSIEEKELQQNDCGVMIGPVIDGSTTILSASTTIPSKTSSWNVYNCDMECILISVKELDC